MLKDNFKPRGAIFDQDGLLFDTEVVFERCWIEEGLKLGIEVDTGFVNKMSGCGRKELTSIVAKTFPEIDAEDYVERVHRAAAEAQLAMTPAIKPGAREILEFCRDNGLKIALASSSMRRCVDHNLAASGLVGFFDAIVTGRDVLNGKPAPDIFLLAAQKIGLPADQCVVFEDSFNGIRAAHAAGATAIMIPDRAAPTPEILELCTSFVTLHDALSSIRQWRGIRGEGSGKRKKKDIPLLNFGFQTLKEGLEHVFNPRVQTPNLQSSQTPRSESK